MKWGSPRELIQLVLTLIIVTLGILAMYGNWLAALFGFGAPVE